ncbi:MAG: electron transfer flavoprotein subunit alpha/FixB family protein [Nocardioides sp.]|jgi:electron transfer flavoprotein alpha subunit
MIIVLVEIEQGAPAEVSLETVAFARSLSEAGGGVPIDAVVVGDLGDSASALAAYGVRRVYQAVGDDFGSFGGGAWASALLAAREAAGAVVVTAAGTNRGNEALAHVAARLDAPMAANVIAFASLAPFTVTRQVVGGAAWEELVLGMRPAIFSVAGHAVAAEPAATPGAAEVVALNVVLTEQDRVSRVASVEQASGGDSSGLKDAKFVVGAGRGAGGPNGFDAVDAVAAKLGGVVGVSRVVTSLGWRPHHEQVGQTGTRIAPDVYLACGISGAIQHWAGCASSKTIIAVNTDAEAPMVTKADYALIGDMHEVLPALLEQL